MANKELETFGKYRLLARLAQGGMAELFLGVQQGVRGFEKVVVIKRILPALSSSSEFVEMFLDEARLAARLDHPNIVRIYDLGEVDSQYFIAMEYIPGEDLASVGEMIRRAKSKVPAEIATEIILGAAEGLAYAHGLEDAEGQPVNIVHRDISPSNIIASYLGGVKVVDFGIARATSNVSRTSPGARKGKSQYLAPEQATGKPVDARADLFALGIVLHELLTGVKLFRRDNDLASINAIIGDDINPPSAWRPEIPPELDAIVMKALERDLFRRYQTASDMAADLHKFLASKGHLPTSSKMPAFLTTLFGEERKRKKVRFAQAGSVEDVGKSGRGATSPGTQLPTPTGLPKSVTPVRTPPGASSRPSSAAPVARQNTPSKPPSRPGSTTPVPGPVGPRPPTNPGLGPATTLRPPTNPGVAPAPEARPPSNPGVTPAPEARPPSNPGVAPAPEAPPPSNPGVAAAPPAGQDAPPPNRTPSSPGSRPGSSPGSNPGAAAGQPRTSTGALGAGEVFANFGKYRVIQRIGAGGMAEVYKCILSGIGGFEKTVVVKRIKDALLNDEEFVKMFLDEARVAAFLSHPNIVQTFEVDEIDGCPYIAMEFVLGPTLSALLRRAKKANILNYLYGAKIMSGIAEGLYHAHNAVDSSGSPLRVVHRDVTPQNVMISYEGVPKLLDFGVARAAGRQHETQVGTLKGKLRYMAPEQLRGAEIDARADIYAAGLCLYEATTGDPPYGKRSDPEIIRDVMVGATGVPDTFPEGYPPELEKIVRWAVDPDPDDRCPNGMELHKALESFLLGTGSPVTPLDIAGYIAALFQDTTVPSSYQPGNASSAISKPGSQPIGRAGTNLPPRPSGPFPAVGPNGLPFTGTLPPPDLTASAVPEAQPPAPPPDASPPTSGDGLAQAPELAAVAPAKPSRAPLFAGIGAAVALLLGTGGYLATRTPTKADVPVETRPKPDLPKPPDPKPDVPKPDKPPDPKPPDTPGLKVGALKLEGMPAGAKATIDGNPAGAGEQYLAAGPHKVVVQAAGYFGFETSVDVEVGQVKAVKVELKAIPVAPRGYVEINCSPWCQISVDGKETGKTSPAKIQLNVGQHVLMLTNPPAGLAKKVTINVAENATVAKTVNLEE